MKLKTTIFALLYASSTIAGQLNVQLENDFPWHVDSGYTHGSRIEWVSDSKIRFGVQQQMYSAEDLRLEDQVPGEQPYAGTLLGFVGYKDMYRLSDTLSACDDYELLIGILGPSSHADDVQRCIHKWLGCKDPKGWKHQLHDEFEIEASWWRGYDKLLLGHDYGWNLRWVSETGGLLGTLQIALGANSELRLGYGFGAAEDNHEVRVRGIEKPAGHAYGMIGCGGRIWFRNELLEGNAHYVHNHESIPVDMETSTGCLKTGFGVRYKSLDVKCLWLWWTKEYKTQKSVPHYMSLTVGWEF